VTYFTLTGARVKDWKPTVKANGFVCQPCSWNEILEYHCQASTIRSNTYTRERAMFNRKFRSVFSTGLKRTAEKQTVEGTIWLGQMTL
jgi:hypothetical protein